MFTWDSNRGGREAFIMPSIDALEALQDIQVSIMVGDEERDLNSLHIEYPEYAGDFTKLQRGRLAQQTLTLSYAMLPIPSDEDLELDAFDDEVSEELKVLGYME